MSKKNGKHPEFPAPQEGSDYAKLIAEGGSCLEPEYVDALPVPIGPGEADKALTEWSKLYRQRESVLEERRDAMAGFKKTLDGIDEQMKALAETVETKKKKQNVRCVDVLDKTNLIHVVRLDTGAEVSTKQATAADLQQNIPGSEGKPAQTQADA